MAGIPKFNNVVREFIEQTLKTGAGIGKIIDDIAEIYPQFKPAAEDEQARETLYQRITKIKSRLPPPRQKEAWETIPHYLSPHWRVAYFRTLLNTTDDINVKIRLLREIRTEVTMIDKQNTLEEPKRKKQHEEERIQSRLNDPHHIAYEQACINDLILDGSVLPINAYEQISEHTFRRIEDGVEVDAHGKPYKHGEKSHNTWLNEQDGVYNYELDKR